MKSHTQFKEQLVQYLNIRHPSLGKTFNDATANEIAKLTNLGITPKDSSVKELYPINPTPITQNSGFKFGAASRKELEGVNTDLVLCANLALSYSTQDFCVFDGIRTYKEQQQHVANGTSRTMNSKHLQGLAIDLVPWINGGPVWDWEGCYKVALAMDKAASELGIANRITWGGAWDRKLSQFGGKADLYEKEVQAYRARNVGSDFIDGPHFEILL